MAGRIRCRELAAVLAATMTMTLPLVLPARVDAEVARSHRAHGRTAGRRTSETRVVPGGEVVVNRPRSVFDCDTPRGEAWYGSAERCLSELCAGGNFTNQYIDGADNRLRKNPCYGRDPYELQR